VNKDKFDPLAEQPQAATLRYSVYQVEDPNDYNKKKMVMKLENIKYNEQMFNNKNVKHNFKPYDTIGNRFFNNFKRRYLKKKSSPEKYQIKDSVPKYKISNTSYELKRST